MKNSVRLLVVSAVVLAGASAALAASPAIKERQDILKGFGDATKPVVAMLKGQAPFDLAAAQKALRTYEAGVKKLPSLFPPDSKTGDKTEALPKIWDEKAKFDAIYAKLGKDAAAALTTIKDEASLKSTFPKVLGNCKACHDDYRQKQ